MKPLKSRPSEVNSPLVPQPAVFLEALEPRIAPASLVGIDYKAVTLGSPQLLKAGEGLNTSSDSGSYILAVEKGQALVYTTDVNGNNQFDANEITGIAAGDGLRLTSFVDINGDVVTNLQSDGNLSDSDGDASNGRDGLQLLNSKIEGLTLRSVTSADLKPDDLVANRLILSSYSIHGNVYAGGGVGVSGAGIVIDTVGLAAQVKKFTGSSGVYQVPTITPTLGAIKTGTAAGENFFSFGYETVGADAGAMQTGGYLKVFTPGIGQAGGDFYGLKVGDNSAATTVSTGAPAAIFAAKPFSLDAIVTGNGGIGAKGGDIRDVSLLGDTAGLRLVAGDGGKGITGGAGGSILNLTDLGSTNGVVEIHTGTGGEGFLGAGGSAGSISFGQFLMNGDISIGLGGGGTALVNAGSGTSLLKGALTPTDADGLSSAVHVLSTYHEVGQIGSMTSIDFNQDGFTDIVFLTNTPDQIGVKFGSDGGIFSDTPTLYFAAPNFSSLADRSSAIAVGDFDGDTFLDIATASSQPNSLDGIHVFLNPGGIGDANGWFQAAQQTDGGNYVDSSIHSVLPLLNPYGGILRSGAAITNLAAGDFNGDGTLDLAYTSQSFIWDTDVLKPVTTAVMLTGAGDGRFFPDFRYERTTNTQTMMPVLNGGYDIFPNRGYYNKSHGEYVLQATTADTNEPTSDSNPDILIFGEMQNSKKADINLVQFNYLNDLYPDGSLDIVDATKPTYDVADKFDANGDIIGWNTKSGKPTDATPLGVSIADVGGDGIFDVVVLDQEQTVTVLEGIVDATFKFGLNNGISLIEDGALLGPNAKVDFKGIVAGDFGGGTSAQFALYSYLTDDAGLKGFQMFDLDGFVLHRPTDPNAYHADLSLIPGTVKATTIAPPEAYNEKIIAFDIFKTLSTDTEFGFVSAAPTTTKTGWFASSTDPLFFTLSSYDISLWAGDGGNSHLGAGGVGGSIGSGTVSSSGSTGGSSTLSASFSVVLPGDEYLQPDMSYLGGSGGSGFTNGGSGGGLSGLLVSYAAGTSVLNSDIEFNAGDGGAGLTGTGGAGGNLSGMKVMSGWKFSAGAGGFGYQGGVGGGINGNSGVDGYTTYTSWAVLSSGEGGLGISAGGNGGTITGFATEFIKLIGGVGGYLEYVAGDGGFSMSGRGGSGGSILNSSPINASNNLAGPILLQAGTGADGLTGGSGGSITNFSNLSTIDTPVSLVSVLAGNGGVGVVGNGGNGGSVSSFVASGSGIYTDFNRDTYQFNRVIAGDGGDSFGAQGGTGGALTSVTTTANSSAAAAASGHGGDGLKRGGDGGVILGTTVDSAAGEAAKVIVWAGSGGNAFAALSTASNVGNAGDSSTILNLRAFGAVNGIGGNGGNITNFSQPKTTLCAVDLIAGNGGSTINYGSPGNSTTGVGRGGSLSGITLAGEVGRVNSSVAIVSYANNFVQDTLRDDPFTQLTDDLGNVGVIAGIAGRVKGDLPAGDAAAKTGSVTNLTARSIMSMVAGSVDRIAAINTISGIKITSNDGQLGAYKTVPVPAGANHSETLPIYYSGPNHTGALVASPQIGGSLADGVILVQTNNSGLTGARLKVL